MYRFLLLATLLISSTSSAIPSSNTPTERLAVYQQGYISLSGTSISGLKIGMSENEAIEKLGVPKSRKTESNECTGTYDTTLKYTNLVLYFLGDSNKTSKSYLSSMITNNARYVTNKGIRVGDLMSKAEKAYSKAAVTGKTGRYLSLADSKNPECAIAFFSANSKIVSEINLVCAIC